MRDYEITLVFVPDKNSEEEAPTPLDKVTEWIVRKGGAVSEIRHWGKRKLAYAIGKSMEGDYVLADVQMEPEWIGQLEASLDLSEDVLRYLVVKKED